MSQKLWTISGTSPAAAGTAQLGTAATGVSEYREVTVFANLIGATGGTLDVYIQRRVDKDVWRDWCHFAQLASGASAVVTTVAPSLVATGAAVVVGTGTDATPAPALAAATFLGGHPGDHIRVVCVAGASTSAGAAIAIRILGIG